MKYFDFSWLELKWISQTEFASFCATFTIRKFVGLKLNIAVCICVGRILNLQIITTKTRPTSRIVVYSIFSPRNLKFEWSITRIGQCKQKWCIIFLKTSTGITWPRHRRVTTENKPFCTFDQGHCVRFAVTQLMKGLSSKSISTSSQ